MKQYAVAIDGPAGSGKSTVAKKIAQRMHLLYIDTGAMYRAVALFCIQRGIPTEEEKKVIEVLDEIQLDILLQEGGQQILLNQKEVTDQIRSQEAGKGASDVATILQVREKLTQMQRQLAQGNAVIMDGRDIGTHVLPHAQVKIYLDANTEERAKRRCHELELLHETVEFDKVKQQIEARDEADKNRKYHPLRKAEDAVTLDTSKMDVDAVVDAICQMIEKRMSREG